jgi:hypothetical protein
MSIHEFIFSSQPKHRIARHILLWTLCYAYLVICYPPYGTDTPDGLETGGPVMFFEKAGIRGLFHLICQMFFCFPVLYFLMPVFFWKKKYVQFGLGLLISWTCVSFFRYLAFNFAMDPILNTLGLPLNTTRLTLNASFAQTISGPAFVSFIFISMKIFKDYLQKQQENIILYQENFNAQLQFLKAQVHPHFLFNTLNNIYFFILSEPVKAKFLIRKLEKMLHYMVNECDQAVVPLTEEINMIYDYIELEKVRYADLDIELEITGDCADKKIAPLLMIPFIENSFKHGTSKVLRDPWIRLFIQVDEAVLHFTLANNKPGEAILKENGIGLINVRKRLGLLYAENHYLLVKPTENTFTVNMQIPLEQKYAG